MPVVPATGKAEVTRWLELGVRAVLCSSGVQGKHQPFNYSCEEPSSHCSLGKQKVEGKMGQGSRVECDGLLFLVTLGRYLMMKTGIKSLVPPSMCMLQIQLSCTAA